MFDFKNLLLEFDQLYESNNAGLWRRVNSTRTECMARQTSVYTRLNWDRSKERLSPPIGAYAELLSDTGVKFELQGGPISDKIEWLSYSAESIKNAECYHMSINKNKVIGTKFL